MYDLVVYPRSTITEIISDLGYGTASIWAKYPEKDKHFRSIVYDLGLRWSWDAMRWQRRIGDLAGWPQDRAAEVGQHLLLGGFPLRFPDERTRDMAVQGDWEPECRRWLLTGKGEYAGWFRLWWGREVNVYDAAREITGSRYDGVTKCVVAPVEVFDEVLDFVETYDFRVHPKAEALLRQARKQRAQAYVADVAALHAEDAPAYVGRARLKAEVGTVAPQFRDFVGLEFETRTALLPHQLPAVDRVGKSTIGGFFMDMGTGKTRCSIELVHLRRARISRVVWFCPVSLKETALTEFLKHTTLAPTQVYVFDDTTTLRTAPRDAAVYVVGIESMSSSDRTVLTAADLIDAHTMVVVDESSYIKGHNALRTRRITSLAEKARYRLILTGTPLTQGVEDLFAQMRFLSTEILGYASFYSFARNHLEYSEKYPGMVVRAHNVDWLTAKISPYVYQVTKEDAGLNLPEKLYESRYFRFTEEQAELYERVKQQILADAVYEEYDSVVIFRLFGALQQIASGFWNDDGARVDVPHRRVETLLGIVEGVAPGEKLVVWCKFVHSVQQVTAGLRDVYGEGCVALYYGALNEHARNQSLARFCDPEDARFLVATMATGGHGLTLTEAAYSVFYENSFKYAERVQAEDRIHRIGQTRRPTYIDVYASCGIERRIAEAIVRKEDVAQSFRRAVDRAGAEESGRIFGDL